MKENSYLDVQKQMANTTPPKRIPPPPPPQLKQNIKNEEKPSCMSILKPTAAHCNVHGYHV